MPLAPIGLPTPKGRPSLVGLVPHLGALCNPQEAIRLTLRGPHRYLNTTV